ncbi:hypothetical protein V1477_011530 [Vespula maculifrons]|uniref:Odorant receptor n=1 Tax=Vespula maculifrons TaxID=7453 RepID=A0ABD2BZH5_VESMC
MLITIYTQKEGITSDIFTISFNTERVDVDVLVTMSIRGMSYYEKHFFFSNQLVKLLIGLRPSQNAKKQLLLFCIVTVYVFPMFVFQRKLFHAHFIYDYAQLSDENELMVFKKYTKQSKIYTYFFVDKIHLRLPFPINGISSPGSLYYSLFIYQTIAIYIFLTISSVCHALFFISIQHACCLFCVLKSKIRQPFLNEKNYNHIACLNKKKEEFDWIVDVIIRHRRFYQLYTSDVTFHSTVKLMHNTLCNLCSLITYGFICLNFDARKLFHAHFILDYARLSDENELMVFKQYTKQSKIYTYFFVAILNFYFIAIISPCILNLSLYLFGMLDKIHLKLPFPINGVSSPGPLYYSLFIYQTIAIYIFITIAVVCYTSFLISIQHACCQLYVLKQKIRQPFLNKKNYNQISLLNKKQEEEFYWIVDIIMRHRRVTEFVDHVNSISNVIYLICAFLGMILIILDFLSIFQLAALMQNTNELMECSTYIFASLFGVYINFYIGQMLINHSDAAFEEL